MLPTIALAEESDAFWQYANAPGEYIYNVSGNFNSEGPTVDTTFTLTQPTKITGISGTTIPVTANTILYAIWEKIPQKSKTPAAVANMYQRKQRSRQIQSLKRVRSPLRLPGKR